MAIERTEFPETGDWWEYYGYLCHDAAHEVKRITVEALGLETDQPGIDWKRVNVHDINRVMVLRSTTAWSYGPITLETMKTIREEHFDTVYSHMNRIYGELPPLARSGVRPSGKSSILRSFVRHLFHRN